MDILTFLQAIVNVTQAKVLALLILANLVLGTVASIKEGKFEVNRLKDFLRRTLVVFGGYLGAALAGAALADFSPLRTVAWAALVAFLAAQIVGNLRALGLPLPDSVTKWIERTSS